MSSFKSEEEEKKDTVVKLEDILGDVYSLKFKKHGKQRVEAPTQAETHAMKKRPYEDEDSLLNEDPV